MSDDKDGKIMDNSDKTGSIKTSKRPGEEVKKMSRKEKREYYITRVCEESGLDRDHVAKELDFAKANGIQYKVYCHKGYWFIPHDLLLKVHFNGRRRRKMARIIAKKRGRSHNEIEKEMLEAKYTIGLRFRFFKSFDWDLLTEEQKDSILLKPFSEQMSMKYRKDDADPYVLNVKPRFYTEFADSIGREWFVYEPEMSEDEFKEKIKDFNNKCVIYKPTCGSGGVGVKKYPLTEDPGELYALLKKDECGAALVEECLVQHPDMDSLCPDSINTIRAVTLYWDGKYHLLYTACRMGSGKGLPVDSVGRGGLNISVNMETGIFDTVAGDHSARPHETHPATGKYLPGFQVPCWQEVLDLAKRSAIKTYEIAGLGYVGWDIGITPDGPVLVEGNNWPDTTPIQLCNWADAKRGMKFMLEPYL